MSSENQGSEKRLILFTIVTFLSILAIQYGMDLAGLTPPPPPPKKPDAPVAQVNPGAGNDKPGFVGELPANPFVGDWQPGDEMAPAKAKPAPAVALLGPEELTLGTTRKTNGYRLEVQLEQKGAGVSSVASSRYEAEFLPKQPLPWPLQILKYDPLAPPSLSMSLVLPLDRRVNAEEAEAAGLVLPDSGEMSLAGVVWEVVRDDQGRAVRPVTRPVPAHVKVARGQPSPDVTDGQAVVFRTKVDALGLVLTRTYRLFKGDDGFETDLTIESPEKARTVVYRLLGPHGIPIEGEWYTGTFREAIFAQADGSGVKVKTLPAYDIAKRGRENPEKFQFAQPLRYSGVENQYFAVVLEPFPPPTTQSERWDAEAVPVILHEDPEAKQKADIGVEVTSKPIPVGPNVPVTHTYKVFAGPKTAEALAPFGAEELATYRKSNWIPLAPQLAKSIIAPLLDSTYEATRAISAAFGGKSGNYGVAIILLTMLVRLAMFPLTRKQALSAKKMQDLQPYLKEIQEKYKDDKEKQGKETWAFYNRHGVNPVKGCLPALIQLPIFVGLWQALNNSVHLRHASFLYIRDLSAPDMMFTFPTTVPFLGDYFNLLPFLVVALMLVQTKLFSPPATTPEAEAQQKMMKYMMVFMAFMFYKVPSGLGIYFITSSLWQISERLLLPRITHAPAPSLGNSDDGKNPPGGGGGGGGNGRGNNGGPTPPVKPPGKFGQFFAKVLEEAQKNPTYRNLADEKNRTGGDRRDRDRSDRDRRDKGKPRAKPGRRR